MPPPPASSPLHAGGSRMSPNTLLLEFLPTLGMMAVSLLIGYLCARTGLIEQRELAGLSKMVGWFCLPALLFKTLAQTDLRTIDWALVGGVGLAKAVVFVLVVALTMVGERRRSKLPRGRQLVEAGMRAIMATQSNDFAFGIPILSALYDTTHPEFVVLIYVLAPISLVILNPLAFALCEVGLLKEDEERGPNPSSGAAAEESSDPATTTAAAAAAAVAGEGEREEEDQARATDAVWRSAPLALFARKSGGGAGLAGATAPADSEGSLPSSLSLSAASAAPSEAIGLTVLRQVGSNPVVIMTFLGLVVGAGLQGRALPPFFAKLLQGWADVFPVAALFLMGASMHGSAGLTDDRTYLFMVVLVLACKTLLLPVLAYFLVSAVGGSADLAILAFIIGAFPVAPTVSIYGLRYCRPAATEGGAPQVQATDQASLSVAVVLSTLAAIPILLISVVALEVHAQPGADAGLFDDAVFYMRIASGVAAGWACLCFLLEAAAPASSSSPHHHHLPSRHYPIVALAALALLQAAAGGTCHDSVASPSPTATSFLLLLAGVGTYLATVLAGLGAARLLRGRKAHVVALGAAGVLAVVLAGVGARLGGKDDDDDSGSGSGGSDGYRTCTPTRSTRLDPLVAAVAILACVASVAATYVYPALADKRRSSAPTVLPPAAPGLSLQAPLLDAAADHADDDDDASIDGSRVGGGSGAATTAAAASPSTRRPSRRLKLLVAFACLSMLVAAGRCLMRMTAGRSSSSASNDRLDYLTFIDAALATLLAPVLCCLYALDRHLYIYTMARRGFRRAARCCLGAGAMAGWRKGAGGKGQREE